MKEIRNKPSEIGFFNTYRKAMVALWRIDYDGAHKYQCVDLVRHFTVVNKYPPMIKWDAIDIWNKWVGTWYKIIKNTLTNYPPVGALVFWWGWKYGHTAIAWRCNPLWLNVLEQNWWSGSSTWTWDDAIRHVSKSYKKILGWAIPII